MQFSGMIDLERTGMLKRKITKKIAAWYKQSETALLIDGARQIGKTTIIEDFFETNNIKYAKLNLYENKTAREAFNTSTNTDQLLLRIRSLCSITDEKVIFIDEIQEADDAITPIKFLVEDSSFRYIFSGSLLGVKMQEILSVPVGFLTTFKMYPMDFEEFLWANRISERTISYLKERFEKREPVDEIIHKQMMDVFNVYLAVGGMPKAVTTFLSSKNITKVNMALRDIDEGYRADIAKYKKDQKFLIQEIYDLIPSELNAQNKRFILKDLNEKARYYRYEPSLVWLKNSGVGLFVFNVDNPIPPLKGSKERTLFKLFLCDTGLLSYKLFNGHQAILLNGDAHLNFGSIYESIAAQELNSHNFSLFYNNDKKRGEIDFLIEKGGKVIPIEIKSGKDYKRHRALTSLLNNDTFGYEYGYVFYNGNVEIQDKTIYMPIYMIAFLENLEEDADQIVSLDISALL